MKIKSLLIGSAALMTVSTGARAADAIVYAEPEPVEYVRVCDVYGAGFFYIPGTETCLKIGGYMRFQVNFPAGFGGYSSFARFAPSFDVRSENEWGTLRGFAELEMNYDSARVTTTSVSPAGVLTTTTAPIGNNFNLAHAFIELQTASGALRLGRTHSPYSRFLGYGPPGFVNDGPYGFRNTQEISYTFTGGNGFSAIVALVDNLNSNTWATDVEAGVNFAQGWGSIGAIAGYDAVTTNWGAKAVARFNMPNSGISAGLHVFYASGPGSYAITDPGPLAVAAVGSHWSVLGHVKAAFSPKVAAGVSAQWFDYTGGWQFVGHLDLTPVQGFRIRPEVVYRTSGGATAWAGLVRFDRTF